MSAPIHGLAIADYHNHDAISFSKLTEFIESSLGFFETRVLKSRQKPYERAAHFEIGQLFHFHMQNGLPLYEHIAVNDKFDSWRTNESKAWRAAQEAAGKIVVSPDDLAAVEKMAARVKAHGVVSKLLEGTDCEVTFRKDFGKWAVQCRPDRYRSDFVADFKTVPSIENFERNVVDFRYHMQAAWYQEVINTCLESPDDAPKPRFIFIVVEKEPPYEVKPFEIDEDSLAVGRAEVIMALKRMKQCFDSGIWTRSEEIEKVSLPRWYVSKAEKNLLEQRAKLELT